MKGRTPKRYAMDTRLFNMKNWKRDICLVIMMMPVVAYFIIFCYLPMTGLAMSFTQFKPGSGFSGIFSGKSVGLKMAFFEA